MEQQRRSEENNGFICGVIEGFYGRPWTTEQRKDLFRKLKKWGMAAYVYAPKDDYKHRAFWRELYTVEEADHLSSLIAAAKEHGIRFYYALSPGLDMTYSSQKEIQTLKRKLDQVSQFGCDAFALLFDDIEPELSKADKEVFQTFGNAQVSVTNEIYMHLGAPYFLFCPTQYCSSRSVPTVHDSEYLNTLGSKLNHDIDIMWTGKKVISKTITLEAIQEVTEVLRRPPVIWDNLHANDYDQKRVFLGPYTGRSPELIAHLRGVMTNPNCEFHANTIAINTLAYWSRCNLDAKVNSSISADIKLETENEDGTNAEDLPIDCCSSKNVYHPKAALKSAIEEWLPEFFIKKEAWGPITKPQPQVTSNIDIKVVTPIIPIIPSVNTCMSLTTTTTTSTTTKTATVPEINTTQLQALADVCSTVNSSVVNPMQNPVMNSLVSPTKVVTNDDILNPIPTAAVCNIELPKKVPISIVPMPILQTMTTTTATSACLSEMRVSVSTSEDIKSTHMPTMVAVETKGLGLVDHDKVRNDEHQLNEASVNEISNSIPEAGIDGFGTGANNVMEPKLLEEPETVEMKVAEEHAGIEEETHENMVVTTDTKCGTNAVISEADSTVGSKTEKAIDEDIAIADEKMSGNDIVSTTALLVKSIAESTVESTVPCHAAGDKMLEENNLSPSSGGEGEYNEPMECSSLTSQISPKDERKVAAGSVEDVIMTDTASVNEEIYQNNMQIESTEASPVSNNAEMKEDGEECCVLSKSNSIVEEANRMTAEDLHLLCDLFYLPFEHGNRGHKLLNEFNWLKGNACVLLNNSSHARGDNKKTNPSPVTDTPKPEVAEWLQRSDRFSELCDTVLVLLRKLAVCANKEICHDLFSYVWDIAGALIILNAFIKWLRLGHFPANIHTYTQGTYTWFSKGWKEAFTSGDQEPWVFRGGLIADLQRLMPVDSGNDLFFYKLPELPTSDYYLLRPYKLLDESAVYQICNRCHLSLLAVEETGSGEKGVGVNENLSDLIGDSVVGAFLTLQPEFCIVAHEADDESAIIGYAAAALDVNIFARNFEICWLPDVCEKYPKTLIDAHDKKFEENKIKAKTKESSPSSTSESSTANNDLEPNAADGAAAEVLLTNLNLTEIQNSMLHEFHDHKYDCPPAVSSTYPAVLTTAILDKALIHDQAIAKRLMTVILAALRANGVFGVHVRVDVKHMEKLSQYYSKNGFLEVFRDERYAYMGRRF